MIYWIQYLILVWCCLLDAVSMINYGSQSQAFLYQPPEDSDDEDSDLVQDMFGHSIQSETSSEASSLSEESSEDEGMLDDEECKRHGLPLIIPLFDYEESKRHWSLLIILLID